MRHYSKSILSSLLLLLFSLSFTSCVEDNNVNNVNNVIKYDIVNDDNADPKVVKEILMMYVQLLGDEQIATIQSQEELEQLFGSRTISVTLENIDFEKYTVILGTKGVCNGLSKLTHSFKYKENKTYEYTIKIICNCTCEAPTFTFGIIVEKLPVGSNVILKTIIDKI